MISIVFKLLFTSFSLMYLKLSGAEEALAQKDIAYPYQVQFMQSWDWYRYDAQLMTSHIVPIFSQDLISDKDEIVLRGYKASYGKWHVPTDILFLSIINSSITLTCEFCFYFVKLCLLFKKYEDNFRLHWSL